MSLQNWANNGWLKRQDNNVNELIEFTTELRGDVLVWLRQNHPNLLVKS